jgi:hypothetical protein
MLGRERWIICLIQLGLIRIELFGSWGKWSCIRLIEFLSFHRRPCIFHFMLGFDVSYGERENSWLTLLSKHGHSFIALGLHWDYLVHAFHFLLTIRP